MKVVVRDVAGKLKYHRLKPGGVRVKVVVRGLAMKLKDHRLKPGGVSHDKPTFGRHFRYVLEFARLLPNSLAYFGG